MKLPFNIVLTPLLKPYFSNTKVFCRSPTFSVSIPYTCIYGAVGLFINVHHLRTHLGELPITGDLVAKDEASLKRSMIVHDLKIIATSLGLVQYCCLVVGCATQNPSLFLPHLTGQLVVVIVKILNLFLYIPQLDLKTVGKLVQKIFAIMLMSFNWLQEFCVFRQYLCVCDL